MKQVLGDGAGEAERESFESDALKALRAIQTIFERNVTFVGGGPESHVRVPFESHDQAWNHWHEARDIIRAALADPTTSVLAKKHDGMRVDYSGLLGQCQRALRNRGESANAEMLRQLQGHLKELGERWYEGDMHVVDEILQLYCIEKDARAAIAAAPVFQPQHGEEA